MSSCGLCKEKVERNQQKLECSLCRLFFHVQCLKMNSVDFDFIKKEKLKWKCYECTNSRKSLSSNSKSPPVSPPIISDSNSIPKSQNDLVVNDVNSSNKLENINKSIIFLTKLVKDNHSYLTSEIKNIEENLLLSNNSLKEENKN